MKFHGGNIVRKLECSLLARTALLYWLLYVRVLLYNIVHGYGQDNSSTYISTYKRGWAARALRQTPCPLRGSTPIVVAQRDSAVALKSHTHFGIVFCSLLAPNMLPKRCKIHQKASSAGPLLETSFPAPSFLVSGSPKTLIFELAPIRELNFHKITFLQKCTKSTEKDPPKRGQIHQKPLQKRSQRNTRKNVRKYV